MSEISETKSLASHLRWTDSIKLRLYCASCSHRQFPALQAIAEFTSAVNQPESVLTEVTLTCGHTRDFEYLIYRAPAQKETIKKRLSAKAKEEELEELSAQQEEADRLAQQEADEIRAIANQFYGEPEQILISDTIEELSSSWGL